MGMCEKIKVDRVLCDEIFYFQTSRLNIPFPVGADPNSRISDAVANVRVLDCEFSCVDDTPVVTLTLMFEEDFTLVASNPAFRDLPMEFQFPLTEARSFQKCTCSEMAEIATSFDRIKCEVFDVTGILDITANTFHSIFSETVTATVKLKLVEEVQTVVALCPAEHQSGLVINII